MSHHDALAAVGIAAVHGPAGDPDFVPPSVWTVGGLTFLLALMGWMPAPLDIGAWTSLWILEKNRGRETPPTLRAALLAWYDRRGRDLPWRVRPADPDSTERGDTPQGRRTVCAARSLPLPCRSPDVPRARRWLPRPGPAGSGPR